MSEWYYAHGGEQKGPVPVSELQRLAANGDFDPQSDLVWREGLPDWTTCDKIDELKGSFGGGGEPEAPETATTSSTSDAGSMTNPYSSPTQSPVSTSAAPAPIGIAPTAGVAIASIICGIIGLVICCAWYVSAPISIAAIITGHIAMSKIKANPQGLKGKGLATTGLITGYLGLLLAILVGILAIYLMTLDPEKIQDLEWLPDEVKESYQKEMEKQMEMMNE